jgi:carbonic anhydrase
VRLKAACLFCVLFLLSASYSLGQENKPAEKHHWGYSGDGAPQYWSNLDPKYEACGKGLEQSPIDIETARKAHLPSLHFNYQPTPLNIVNNGHTIMVAYAPGSTLVVGDKTYDLKQFHFHHPSEEQIKGHPRDMVVHLVHQDKDGHLAVVAVLLKAEHASAVLNVLWSHLPKTEEDPVVNKNITINAKDLLPAKHNYYTFEGSLTTPPCSEGVEWYVLKHPEHVSPSQVQTFAKLYPDNARPVQPLHDRTVLEGGK